jgi:hypothetical protein
MSGTPNPHWCGSQGYMTGPGKVDSRLGTGKITNGAYEAIFRRFMSVAGNDRFGWTSPFNRCPSPSSKPSR